VWLYIMPCPTRNRNAQFNLALTMLHVRSPSWSKAAVSSWPLVQGKKLLVGRMNLAGRGGAASQTQPMGGSEGRPGRLARTQVLGLAYASAWGGLKCPGRSHTTDAGSKQCGSHAPPTHLQPAMLPR
jgi:hypothetical protein